MGRGRESLLCEPMVDLSYEYIGGRGKRRAKIIDEIEKKENKICVYVDCVGWG